MHLKMLSAKHQLFFNYLPLTRTQVRILSHNVENDSNWSFPGSEGICVGMKDLHDRHNEGVNGMDNLLGDLT